VTVQAVTELDNKAAHRHTPVLQRHRPFLGRRLDCQPAIFQRVSGMHILAQRELLLPGITGIRKEQGPFFQKLWPPAGLYIRPAG
jgi:hypothetical protein